MMMMMAVSQAPSASDVNTLALGNALAYIAPVTFSTFAAAVAYTGWVPLGLTDDGGVTVEGTAEIVDLKSGFPARTVKKYVSTADINISANLREFRLETLLFQLGQPDVTYTYKTSPAATTTASGSTQTLIKATDATGYLKGMYVEVQNGATGAKYVGKIKSVSGNDITLRYPLGVAPASGGTVKVIDTSSIPLGKVILPKGFGMKIEKTIADGSVMTFYLLNVEPTPGYTFAFADGGGGGEPATIPFNVTAIAKTNVEDGALGSMVIEFADVPDASD